MTTTVNPVSASTSQSVASRESRRRIAARRGYAALLICALCVGLNVIAYSPGQNFEQAENTEFTVTLVLLVVFVVSLLVAAFFTIRNRRDGVLVLLLLAAFAFAWLASVYSLSAHRNVVLAYAICAISVAAFRLVALGRRRDSSPGV